MRASACAGMPAKSPVLLKIAPDLSLNELDDVVHIARSRRVDGMIVANTTIGAPLDIARDRSRQGAGRPVRPAAVSAFDADGGGDLCARRRRVSAGRCRRHRFRRLGADEDSRRRQPDPALFVAGLQGPRPGRRDQDAICLGPAAAPTANSCRRSSAPMPRQITAEDWPV